MSLLAYLRKILMPAAKPMPAMGPVSGLVPETLRYRKKPIVIEAFQMTRTRRINNAGWPIWLHKAWNLEREDVGSLSCSEYPYSRGLDQLQIKTWRGSCSLAGTTGLFAASRANCIHVKTTFSGRRTTR